MTKSEFEKKLRELRRVDAKYKGEYRIDLYSNGKLIACIYGTGNLSEIEVYDYDDGTVLVYTDTIGLTIDNANVTRI